MTLDIETRQLTCAFGDTLALDGVDLHIPAGTLCGLIGRNGSGKTTLLETIAAFRRPSSGDVLVGGRDPYEDPASMASTCLVRETGDLEPDCSVDDSLWLSRLLRPRWNDAQARELLERFELDPGRKVRSLSLGQRSALGTVMGLASNAPLTMFDESYLGLDAVSRRAFYDELLADYLRTERTVIVSTHLIGEVAPLLDHVIVLDHGRVTLHEDVETLRSRGTSLVGPVEAVDRLVADLIVVDERRLGPTKQVAVYGHFGEPRRQAARELGVEVGPVALADLLVHLTDLDDPTRAATQEPA
jgi:ABC-2 type transport system ATP-binding protein